MDQHRTPGSEVVFRLPPNLGRHTTRALIAMLFAGTIVGGLSLMGTSDSPMLNSAGLVVALIAVMLLVTRVVLRRRSAEYRQMRQARKLQAQEQAPPAATRTRSLVEDLALLAALHSRGQITDAEFASIKAKLLEG